MNEFDASLFAIICDVSIDVFEKSKFANYSYAAEHISNMIQRNNASLIDNYITLIYEEVNKFYCMLLADMVGYIYRYFSERQFDIYYPIIREVRNCFDSYSKPL